MLDVRGCSNGAEDNFLKVSCSIKILKSVNNYDDNDDNHQSPNCIITKSAAGRHH